MEGREDDLSEKDEVHGSVSERTGKLSNDIVGEANILTIEGTNMCLLAPGEAGNCAMEEATGKLEPGKEKLIIAEGIMASKDEAAVLKRHPESRSW